MNNSVSSSEAIVMFELMGKALASSKNATSLSVTKVLDESK